jgi:phenylacetaldehyde dehydrogenase
MPTATLEEINPKIRNFMSSSRRMLIDGKWIDAQSGETFPVYNPASGEILHQCAAGDKADIDLAVKAARRAFEEGPWSRLTHGQRGKLIWKLADLIEEHLEEFAQLESLDNGKPLAVARVADVPLAVDLFRYMAGWTTKIEGQTLSTSQLGADYFAYTLREPGIFHC